MVWAYVNQQFSTNTIYQLVSSPNLGLYCKNTHFNKTCNWKPTMNYAKMEITLQHKIRMPRVNSSKKSKELKMINNDFKFTCILLVSPITGFDFKNHVTLHL